MRLRRLVAAAVSVALSVFAGVTTPSAVALQAADTGKPIVVTYDSNGKKSGTANDLPNGTDGPACTRDYYATSKTTKVQDATFDKNKRPVVYVHGWTGSPANWTGKASLPGGIGGAADALRRQTDDRIQN